MGVVREGERGRGAEQTGDYGATRMIIALAGNANWPMAHP